MPLPLRLQESVITFHRRVMRRNQHRLFELEQLVGPSLEIINAHSPVPFNDHSPDAELIAGRPPI